MKEITHLDRVQEVLPVYKILILATIQEHSLKSEPACKPYINILLVSNTLGKKITMIE